MRLERKEETDSLDDGEERCVLQIEVLGKWQQSSKELNDGRSKQQLCDRFARICCRLDAEEVISEEVGQEWR